MQQQILPPSPSRRPSLATPDRRTRARRQTFDTTALFPFSRALRRVFFLMPVRYHNCHVSIHSTFMKDKPFPSSRRRDFIRQAACAAVGTAALTSAIRDLRFMNAAVAQSNITDYKALVCIFLAGGNDSNNLIIPTIQSEYNNYAAIRTPSWRFRSRRANVALPVEFAEQRRPHFRPASRLPGTCRRFRRRQARVSVQHRHAGFPDDPRAISRRAFSKPPQLFSHADQVTQWQTSIPDQPPLDRLGRTLRGSAELGAAQRAHLALVSLAGANTFEVGNIVSQYSVSTSGAISLERRQRRAVARR